MSISPPNLLDGLVRAGREQNRAESHLKSTLSVTPGPVGRADGGEGRGGEHQGADCRPPRSPVAHAARLGL